MTTTLDQKESDEERIFQGFVAEASRNIMSLPHDVLALVFEYFVPPSLGIQDVADAEYWDPSWKYDVDCPCSTDHFDLVLISHVCRAWRKLVIGFPSFWNPLWITDHDYALSRAQEFYQRARTAPLEIAVVDQSWNIVRIHEHKKRARPLGPLYHPMVLLLNLDHNIGQFTKVLRITSAIPLLAEDFFKSPMPILEAMILESVCDSESSVFKLPTPLFGGITPNLRKVSFKFVDFAWEDGLFKNLTFLRIQHDIERRDGDPPLPKITLRRLFQIIQNCPDLVTLDIAFIGDLDAQARFASSSQITMSSLRHLILSGLEDVSTCSALIRGLKMPCLQRLHVSHFGPRISHIDDLVPAAFRFNQVIARAHTIHVAFHCPDSMIEVIYLPGEDTSEFADAVFSTDAPSHGRGNSLQDEVDAVCKFRYEAFESIQAGFTEVYTSLIRRLCSSHIRSLVVCDVGRIVDDPPIDAESLFAHFHSIEELEMHNGIGTDGPSVIHALKVLRGKADAAEESADSVVAMPSLKAIMLIDADFSGGVEDLLVFLRHKKGRSMPVEKIEFIRCQNITPEMMDELRGLAGIVTMGMEDIIVDSDSDSSLGYESDDFLVAGDEHEEVVPEALLQLAHELAHEFDEDIL